MPLEYISEHGPLALLRKDKFPGCQDARVLSKHHSLEIHAPNLRREKNSEHTTTHPIRQVRITTNRHEKKKKLFSFSERFSIFPTIHENRRHTRGGPRAYREIFRYYSAREEFSDRRVLFGQNSCGKSLVHFHALSSKKLALTILFHVSLLQTTKPKNRVTFRKENFYIGRSHGLHSSPSSSASRSIVSTFTRVRGTLDNDNNNKPGAAAGVRASGGAGTTCQPRDHRVTD